MSQSLIFSRIRLFRPFAQMLCGTLLMAIGVNLFLRPAAIFSGGIPGMAVVLLHVIGTNYSAYFGVIVFSLQSFFILVQIPYFGFKKTLKGIVTSVIFSIMTQLTIAPCMGIHISENLLLMSIGGCALMGLGISQVLMSGFRFVGSLGIAEILSDKLGIPPGRSILYLDGLVVFGGACIIGVEQAMVSIIGIYVMSRTINVLTYGKYQYKKLLIITSQLENIRRDMKLQMYQNSDKALSANSMLRTTDNMLVIVIRANQSRLAHQIIRQHDSEAVIIFSELFEEDGQGFERF